MSRAFASSAFGLRLFMRELKSGALNVVLLALMLAAFAITSTGLLGERVERAMLMEAARLVGGDVLLRGDHPLPSELTGELRASGMRSTETVELASSVRAGTSERFRLISAKAVAAGFPLRGRFEVDQGRGKQAVDTRPAAGEAWLALRLKQELGLKLGDRIKLGEAEFTVSAWLLKEPDASFDYFGIAPRVLIALEDLDRTALIQPGARATYRMMAALTPEQDFGLIARLSENLRLKLKAGERVETVADVQAEVREGIERGISFLRLSLLVALLLAGAALALSAWRYNLRHLDSFAVLRALGAGKASLATIVLLQLLLAALMAALVGVLLAKLVDLALAQWLSRMLDLVLPAPGYAPMLQGVVIAVLLLLGFAGPSFWRLREASPMRVLKRSEGDPAPSMLRTTLILMFPLAIFMIIALWLAQSWTLGLTVSLGLVLALLLFAVAAFVLLKLTQSMRTHTAGALRFGLAALSRRPLASTLQVMALATGVSALLTLALMRSDLLAQWRANVGNDAPNRFLINVQDQQLDSVRALLHEEGLADAQLWPMVRGRFVARNDRAVDYAAFESPRARRLAEREFNLSFSDTLPANNTLTAGRFFERQSQQIELSAEVDFARALGWQLGDRIRFDLGGLTLEGSLTSLRRVRWESFQPNFFVLVSPNARKAHSASWIGSFRLNGESKLPERLFAAFPNVSLLDLDTIVSQIRSTVDQVSRAIELMFYFTLFAGLLVLWAAIDATQDERNFDAAVMRVMGASGAQLKSAHRVEFIALGLCTGLLAALSASVMTALIARVIFDFTLSPNLALASSAIGATTALVLLFGLIGTRRVRSTPPSESLRQLNL